MSLGVKFDRFDPGLTVSSVAHAALLLVALAGFASAKKFEDAQESIPVEVVSDKQFNEIMKGEKAAKEVQILPRAQKASETVEKKPETETPEARTEAPATPPPAPKRPPEPPKEEAKETPPIPPVREAALPPPPPEPRPEPPKPKAPPPPPKAEAKPPEEEEKPEAEVIAPKPPQRPVAAKPVEAPEPPKKIRPVAEAAPPKPPAEKPPEPPKPQLKADAVAKFLAQKQAEEPPKPAAKPKAAEPEETRAPLDPNAIKALLNKDKPQQKASASPDPVKTASLGVPNGGASRMSPSLVNQLGSIMTEHYNRCWSKSGLDLKQNYVAQIRVRFRPDGSLAGEPVLLNPSGDPKARSIADSALRAVSLCGPVPLPPALLPFYLEWKDGLLRMDPNET